MKHKTAVSKTLAKLGEKGWLVWEHKTGVAWVKDRGKLRPVRYGLPGSTDIVGIVPHVVTEADVGRTLGVFVGCEVKVGKDTVKTHQKRFADRIQELGARYILVRHDAR